MARAVSLDPLTALRRLRAPLVALAVLLVLAGALPGTAVAGSLCLAVEAVAEGEANADAPDCPFCSSHAPAALPPVATAAEAMHPAPTIGRLVEPTALAPLPRGPPVGGRAPPHA